MTDIFCVRNFEFPYLYKFPGQASDENILYVTRENKLLLQFRRLVVGLSAAVIFWAGLLLQSFLAKAVDVRLGAGFDLGILVVAGAFLVIGWWWVTATWQKSLALVTTKRLAKFIYTTPISRYSLSLPLEMIVDTGAYTKGFIQTLLNLGTFTARSAASSSGVATDDPDRVNKKYFYIHNIKLAEDLQQYISKLLSIHHQQPTGLEKFRPFIPDLKGEARANFIRNNWPEYWS